MLLFVKSIPLTTTKLHSSTGHPPILPSNSIPSGAIIFSHDSSPFDPHSISFTSNSNPNITAPVFNANQPFNGSPVAKYASVLPLARALNQLNRKDRLLAFRPLFAYREQQAKKNRIRPTFYPYPPPYGPSLNYPSDEFELYNPSSYNEITHNELPYDPAYDWYRLPPSQFWQRK